jgi:hypothetical protein
MKKTLLLLMMSLGLAVANATTTGQLVIYTDATWSSELDLIQIKIERTIATPTTNKKAAQNKITDARAIYTLGEGHYEISISGTLVNGQRFMQRDVVEISAEMYSFVAIRELIDGRKGNVFFYIDASMKVAGKNIRDVKVKVNNDYMGSLSKVFAATPKFKEPGTLSLTLPYGVYDIEITGINDKVPTYDPHHNWVRKTKITIDSDATTFIPIRND